VICTRKSPVQNEHKGGVDARGAAGGNRSVGEYLDGQGSRVGLLQLRKAEQEEAGQQDVADGATYEEDAAGRVQLRPSEGDKRTPRTTSSDGGRTCPR
jgi:hypothetical protein